MERDQTNLTVSRKEAERKINIQIKKGQEIKKISIDSWELLRSARVKYDGWYDFNATLLKTVFDTPEISDKYSGVGVGAIVFSNPFEKPNLSDSIKDFQGEVQEQIDKLRSIKEQLELYDEPGKKTVAKKEEAKKLLSNKVFIVHGRDEATKQSVARFLENIGLKPIILHEQASKGRTIIKKLEDYSDVGYAVVLLTADDVGGLKSEEKVSLKPRARQNVIFELGFFIGLLGSERVCPLCQEGVERPSDYEAVVYIPLDERGAWQRDLARELKAVGFQINADNLL